MPKQKYRLLVALIAASATVLAVQAWASGGTLAVRTDFKSYYQREPVSFALKNVSSEPVTVNPAWRVVDSKDNLVFATVAAGSLTLKPGESRRYTWDQRGNTGGDVTPGSYRILFGRSAASRSITVMNKPGSRGFVTFAFRDGEEFRTLLSGPGTLRLAIERYHGLNKKHPSGPLVGDRPNRSPYDPRWTWHLDPNATRMVDLSAEVCDGKPSGVERNYDHWINTVKRYCPWGARVKSLD